jgi:hypothetical protein
LFFLLSTFGCEEPLKDEELDKIPEKYDISGTWSLYAWFSVDCPDCTNLPFNFTEGELILDNEEYNLTLHYTYDNQPDSVLEMGTYYYSSEFFISWNAESSLFLGDIDFYPSGGEFWTVRWRTGRPPDEYNQVYFRNYHVKNDNSMVMLYWYRETDSD